MKGIFTKEWTGLKEATGVMGEPRIDSSEKLLPLLSKPKGARREFSQKLASESQGQGTRMPGRNFDLRKRGVETAKLQPNKEEARIIHVPTSLSPHPPTSH